VASSMVDIESRLSQLASQTMPADEMLEVSRRVMAVADGSHWSRAAAYHGRALYAQGRIAEALAILEQAWQRADQIDDPLAGAMAALRGAACCTTLYDYALAEEWCRREYDRPRSRLLVNLRRLLTDCLAVARVSQGDLVGARELLAEFEGAASNHFLLAYYEGDWERAVLLLRRDLDAARAAGQLFAVGDCASVLGRIARIGNQRAEAQEYLDAALTASLTSPDLNRELFTRIELAVLNADFGRIAQAREQLERCRQILDNGEDWRGHRGSFVYASALISAAEHIRKAKTSDEIWKASVEKGAALRLPEKIADEFRDAIEIFRRYHAPWEEAAAFIFWARVAFAASRHRQAVEKNNLAFAIFERMDSPQWSERLQTAIFRFLTIDSGASSLSMGDLRGSNIFHKEGDFWTISFHGSTFRLRDTVGMHYLRRLVANPGVEFSAQNLVDATHRAILKRGRGKKNRSSHRIGNLNRDHEDAVKERARLMVTKRIKDVIAKIRVTHPELARHFASSIRTGYTCIYVTAEDQPNIWVT
jgi:tetratricopeptide (TPR) repeat protein